MDAPAKPQPSVAAVEPLSDSKRKTVDTKEDEPLKRNVSKEEDSPTSTPAPRRRPFPRQQEPGVVWIRGVDEENDGTIVIGDNTTVVRIPAPPNSTMEPLPASLVPEKNNRPVLVSGTPVDPRKRRRVFGIITCSCVLVLVTALAIGLALRPSKKNSSSQKNIPNRPSSVGPHVQWKIAAETFVGWDDYDVLGWDVAISGNGNTWLAGALQYERLAVRAHGPGRVLVVDDDGTTTTTTSRFEGPADELLYGRAVAISKDGTVWATIRGTAIHVYQRSSNPEEPWIPRGDPLPVQLARDVALSHDGSMMAIGAEDGQEDVVQVHRWVTGINRGWWQPVGSPIVNSNPNDELFGWKLALSNHNNTTMLAIGIPGSDARGESTGSVRVYTLQADDDWQLLGSDLVGIGDADVYGFSLSMDDNCLAVGAPQNADLSLDNSTALGARPGYVRVSCWTGQDWQTIGSPQLVGERSGDAFGLDVSLSGTTMAVGATQANDFGGQLTLYRYFHNDWARVARFDYPQEPGSSCGFSVSLAPGVVVVGCPFMAANGVAEAGVVFIYREEPCDPQVVSPPLCHPKS